MFRLLRRSTLIGLLVFAVLVFGSLSVAQADTFTANYYNDGKKKTANIEMQVNDKYLYGYLPDNTIVIMLYHGHEKKVDIQQDFANETITSINDGAFDMEDTSYIVNDKKYSTGIEFRQIIIPDSVSYLGERWINGLYWDTYIDYNIPTGLKYADRNSLVGLDLDYIPYRDDIYIADTNYCNLRPKSKKITISDEFTFIPTHWFVSAIADEIILPNTITTIKEMAFTFNNITKELILPESLIEIENGGFDFWLKLTNLYIPASLEKIAETCFTDAPLENIVFGEGREILSFTNFQDIPTLKSISLPSTLKVIGSRCFLRTGLEKLIIPAGTTEIGEAAFKNCENLTEVRLPGSLSSIADDAFSGCSDQCVFTVDIDSYAQTWATNNGYQTKVIIPVKEIQLEQNSILVNKGKQISNKASILPDNAGNKKVEWLSSDSSVATVNNGNIKAVSCGECDIVCKATDGSGVQAVCHVSVIQMVQNIQVKDKKATVRFGESYQPEITIKPDDATDKSLTWNSSNPNICSVNENGEIYANGAGTCDITGIANDGSSKSVTIQVSVPIFSISESSCTISEKGETCFSLDLNKADPSIINHKANNQNVLYYLDEQGLHMYPVKKGNTSITLSSKTDPKDKMVISITVEESAVLTEEDPLQAYIILDKNKVDAGENIKASYAICGGKAPYTIIECSAVSRIPQSGTNSKPHREVKGTTGNVSLKAINGSDEIWLELSAKDADGNIIKAESNHTKVRTLQVSYDCSYVIAPRNEPMETAFWVTGGSGKYTVDISWDIFGKNGENGTRGVYKEKKTISDNGTFTYTPTSGYGVEYYLTIKDVKNSNLVLNNYHTRGTVLSDDWTLLVTYDELTATAGKQYNADIHIIGRSLETMDSCFWTFKSEDRSVTDSLSIDPSQFVKKDDNTWTISYTPPCKGSLSLYMEVKGYDETFIVKKIDVE